MRYRHTALITILVGLSVSWVIYLWWRPQSIIVNEWFSFLSVTRSQTVLPEWVVGSLPDALWMMALVTVLIWIWDFQIHRRSVQWFAIALLAGVAFELLQFLHIIPGTYDRIDLLLIIMGGIVPVWVVFLIRRYETQNEKHQLTGCHPPVPGDGYGEL